MTLSLYTKESDMYPIYFSKTNARITVFLGSILLVLSYLKVPCFFLTRFQIPCPGCGITRAFVALLKFNIKDAFFYNPCIFLMPLFFLYFWQNGVVFKNKTLNNMVLILAAVLFLIRYILHIFINYGG